MNKFYKTILQIEMIEERDNPLSELELKEHLRNLEEWSGNMGICNATVLTHKEISVDEAKTKDKFNYFNFDLN